MSKPSVQRSTPLIVIFLNVSLLRLIRLDYYIISIFSKSSVYGIYYVSGKIWMRQIFITWPVFIQIKIGQNVLMSSSIGPF